MKSAKGYPTRSDGRTLCNLRVSNPPLNDDKLTHDIERVYRYCFIGINDIRSVRNPYEKGVKDLRKIVRRVSPQQIESQKLKILLHCSVKLLIHFQNVLYRKESFLCNWKGRRQYRIATDCYLDLLRLVCPKNELEATIALMDVIQEENLFIRHDLSLDLLKALIIVSKIPGSTVVNELWNKVENPKTTTDVSRAIVSLLYEVMDSYDWPVNDETVVCLERLLRIYRTAIGNEIEKKSINPSYKFLKTGLKVCLQRTVDHLGNHQILIVIRHLCSWAVDDSIRDEDVLEFGSNLEYAAYKHATKNFEDTITPEIFNLLTKMIASESRLVSLLGNRVIQYLLDRGDNKSRFETPQIFFEDTRYELNISRYKREDKIFLKNNRAELHDSLIKGILNHCSTRLNLESSYCTICLLAVEIPCGLTAAALVCLAMNLQDLTMEREDIRREITFHIHSCVAAILSLLCWIHNAKVFYQYVNKIIMERARWAPHLNPPVQSHYYFATHHVLWDKPELFFVDWEVRYGLWKCFRLLES